MRLHGSVTKKLRTAGYNDEDSTDACLRFLEDHKTYSDLAAANKLGVAEGTIYNWRRKHTDGLLKGGESSSPKRLVQSFSKEFELRLEKFGYEKGEDEQVISVMSRFLRDAMITSKLTIEQVADKLQTTTDTVKHFIKQSNIPEDIVMQKKAVKEKPKHTKCRAELITPVRNKTTVVNNSTIEQSIEDAIIGNAHSMGKQFIHTMIKGMYVELGEVLQKIKGE